MLSRGNKVKLSIPNIIVEFVMECQPHQLIDVSPVNGSVRFLLNGYECYMDKHLFYEMLDDYEYKKKEEA